MTEFTIRLATADDVALMPALEQSAGELFRTLPDLAHIADGDNLAESRYRELVAGGWCRVATVGGAIGGFIAAEVAGDELHVCELAVALDRQRLGIGRTLMRSVIVDAVVQGLGAVTLTTFNHVAWNAPVYERWGFRVVPDAELGPRLGCILDREAEAGLPRDRRCAMRFVLEATFASEAARSDKAV
jgi:GNAT superfamily N-acetyltransferase